MKKLITTIIVLVSVVCASAQTVQHVVYVKTSDSSPADVTQVVANWIKDNTTKHIVSFSVDMRPTMHAFNLIAVAYEGVWIVYEENDLKPQLLTGSRPG